MKKWITSVLVCSLFSVLAFCQEVFAVKDCPVLIQYRYGAGIFDRTIEELPVHILPRGFHGPRWSAHGTVAHLPFHFRIEIHVDEVAIDVKDQKGHSLKGFPQIRETDLLRHGYRVELPITLEMRKKINGWLHGSIETKNASIRNVILNICGFE